MSAPPKCSIATSNILSSCAQSVTSVFWKMAFAPEDVEGYCETRASASGRRARSAMRTLQPFERRSFAKQKLMPEPAPVMIAVFPCTFIAIVLVVRRIGEEEEETVATFNALDLLSRVFSAQEKPSAAYLYTSQTRQTYRSSVYSRRIHDV